MASTPTYTRHDVASSCRPPTTRSSRALPISAIPPFNTCSLPETSAFGSLPPVHSPTTAIETNSDAERSMSLHQGIRLYPKAITWSVLLSMALIMEGYSTILVPSLFAMDPFKKQFGELQPNGQFEISPAWQSAFVNGGLAGQIIGLFITGTVSEWVGYRYTFIGGLLSMSMIIATPVVATTRAELLIGQCMAGLPWGLFQCVCTVYAADVCPMALRAYLTTYVNACWVLGQLIASVVLRSMNTDTTTWSYRLPFALQWAFPVPLLIVAYYAPESPWWLVRERRLTDAEQSLRRLRTKPDHISDAEFDTSIAATLEVMVQTNEKEIQMRHLAGYRDCFKGVDRRRTEITCMVWIIQTLCGGPMMGFSTYFYEQASLGSSHAYNLSIGQFALGLLGVVVSWTLLTRFGRRTLYLSGQFLTFSCVFLIGILACIPQARKFSIFDPASSGSLPQMVDMSPATLHWFIAALMIAFTLTYDATTGPICYAIVSEIPSTRLRSRTVVIARNCYNISCIIANLITPRMLNPTSWNWGAKSGFFWAATGIVGLVWSWFRLPEPKDRTFMELDELFERKIPARRFKTTNLNRIMYETDDTTRVAGKLAG